MIQSILILIIVLFSYTVAKEDNFVFFSKISNLKVNTLRALNLSLNAYSKLNLKRINYKEIKINLKSAIFFLNEAMSYSPSFEIRKKIDTLKKRIKIFPDEDFKKDLISLYYDIDDLKGNLTEYNLIKEQMENLINSYTPEINKNLITELEVIKEKIKLPLIDIPLEDAETFVAMAYDNLIAGKKNSSKQALEIALSPMINITSRENLYLVLFKDTIYDSYEFYKSDDISQARHFLNKSREYLQKASSLSTETNKNLIRSILIRLIDMLNNFENKEEILKEYIIIIQDLKNL